MQKTTHIIAPFQHANDEDWHAIDVYLERQGQSTSHHVYLWSAKPPNKSLKSDYPIQEIKPYRGAIPQHGALMIFGAHTEVGSWFSHAQFDKVTLIHNVSAPRPLYQAIKRLNTFKHPKTPTVDIVYVSNIIKHIAGLAGRVISAIPSQQRFKPIARITRRVNEPFTVGKICIDARSQHHYDDIALYQTLTEAGIQVSIAGGTCLTTQLHNAKMHRNELIKLSPTISATQHPVFLTSLDCYVARSLKFVNDHYNFAVLEAMLSGLPVICHQDLPVSQLIDHGVNGFIFNNNIEALENINRLKNNANLCSEIGSLAKLKLKQLPKNKD